MSKRVGLFLCALVLAGVIVPSAWAADETNAAKIERLNKKALALYPSAQLAPVKKPYYIVWYQPSPETWRQLKQRAELIICRLSPDGFDEIGRAKLIEPTTVQLRRRGGVCWSHPAYAYKHVSLSRDTSWSIITAVDPTSSSYAWSKRACTIKAAPQIVILVGGSSVNPCLPRPAVCLPCR